MFDDCLFSIHRPHSSEFFGERSNIKTVKTRARIYNLKSIFKISGVPIYQLNAGVSGPFGWIKNGTVDIGIEFELPLNETESVVSIVKEEIIEIKELAMDRILDVLKPNEYHSSVSRDDHHLFSEENDQKVKMNWTVKLRDLKASIPMQSNDLTFWGSAMMWPIIAYMNSNKTLIPINFSTTVDLSNFSGNNTHDMNNKKVLGRYTILD